MLIEYLFHLMFFLFLFHLIEKQAEEKTRKEKKCLRGFSREKNEVNSSIDEEILILKNINGEKYIRILKIRKDENEKRPENDTNNDKSFHVIFDEMQRKKSLKVDGS